MQLNSMMKDEQQVELGKKGDEITFKCADMIRPRDKVYKVVTS